MKRKITLLFLAVSTLFSLKSQVLMQEDFTSPFNPATNDWSIQNLSANSSTIAWFQGNGTVFPAYNGSADDYIGANFACTSNTATGQTLSNWLITPTLNLVNGNVFEFASRTVTNPASFADRLEVYLSTAGSGTNVGTTPTSLGTFSTLILSINPNLSTTGYPDAWTVYQATITGLPSPTLGRIGFRYYVTNGGFGGTNSNYIGVDGVKYSSPCAQPTISIAQTAAGVCSGGTVGLLATTMGTVTVSSYTWNTGQNGSNIVVTPTASGVYTVSGTSPANCIGIQTIAITVTATPNVSVPSYTICSSPAGSATLTATGSAASYSWDTGATTSSIVVSPNVTTTYTLTGFGTGGNCPTSVTTTVTVGSQLSMSVSSTATNLCSGRVATLTAQSAATTYSWSSGQTAPTITVNPTTTTTYSVGGYYGTIPNVCVGGNTITINVLPVPSISVAISPSTICGGSDFTIAAAGAVTYTYLLSSTQGSTNNPLVLTTVTVSAVTPGTIVLGGSGANGCVAAGNITFTINPTPTVNAVAAPTTACVNKTLSITGSGANTYQWSGASTSTAGTITYSSSTAGVKNFTLVGTDAIGCSDSAVVSVNITTCTTVGMQTIDEESKMSVFPNPFTNELKVSDMEGTIILYNALGQAVINSKITGTEVIGTSDLPKGAYILKAYNNDGENVKTIKLLKN